MLLYNDNNDGQTYILQYDQENDQLIKYSSLDPKYSFKSKDVQVSKGLLFVMEKEDLTNKAVLLQASSCNGAQTANCSTCQGNKCLSCLSKFTLEADKCVCKPPQVLQGLFCQDCSGGSTYDSVSNSCICSDGYYYYKALLKCDICPDDCQQCSRVSNVVVCNKCYSNMHRTLDNSNNCICDDGYYDDGVNTACVQCPSNCKTCSLQGQQVVCLTCFENQFRQANSTDCRCSDGYYDNGINPICQKCLSKCNTCQLQNSQVVCLSCNTDTSLFRQQQLPCDCLERYYENPLNSTCQQCPSKCKTCQMQSSQIVCLACNDDPTAYRQQALPCNCQIGYAENTQTSTCQKCPNKCQTCEFQNSQLVCLTCNDLTKSFRNQTPPCECIDGYYEDQSNGICQKCQHNCKTCSNLTACLSCPENSFRKTYINSSSCDCLESYFDNGVQICSKCSELCKTCQSNENDCTSCDITFGRVLRNSRCECSGNYVENVPPVKQCLKLYSCHGTCETCSGNLENQCLVCSANREFTLVSNQNLCKCKQGFFEQTPSYNCSECDPSCLTCSDGDQYSCLTCDETKNRQYDPYAKACRCKSGFIEINKVCKPCHKSCKECFGELENNCSLCFEDTQLRTLQIVDNTNKSCVCGSSFFDNKANQDYLCIPCDGTCKTCSGNGNKQCLDCFDDTQNRKYNNQTQECQCLEGYEDISNNNVCTKIPPCDKTCLTCPRQKLNECLSCFDNSFRELKERQCQCISGYYESPGTQVCNKCDSNCVNCSGNQTTCTSCDESIHQLNKDTKKCECKDGLYLDPKTQNCEKCSLNCKTCKESDIQCTSCQNNFTLNPFQLCEEIFPTKMSNETLRSVYNITESSTYVAIGATATGTVVLAFASPGSSIATQFLLLQKLNFLLLIDQTYPELLYIFFKALGGTSPIEILQKVNVLNHLIKDSKGNMLPNKFKSEQIGESILYNGGGCITLIIFIWGGFIPFLTLYKRNKLIQSGLQSFSTRAHLLKILCERIFTFLVMTIHQIISLIISFSLALQLTCIFRGISSTDELYQPLRIGFCIIMLVYFLGITFWWSQILNNPQYYQSSLIAKHHKNQIQVQIFFLSNSQYRSSWLFHIRNYKIAYLVIENVIFPFIITIFHDNYQAQGILCLIFQSILLLSTIIIRPYYSKLQNISLIIEQVCWVITFTMIIIIGYLINSILNKTNISDSEISLMDQLSWAIVISCLCILFSNPIIVFLQIIVNYKKIWSNIKTFYYYIRKNICCYVEENCELSSQDTVVRPLNNLFDSQGNYFSNRVKHNSILRKYPINQSFLYAESFRGRQSVKFSNSSKLTKQAKPSIEYEMEKGDSGILDSKLKAKDIGLSQNNLTNTHTQLINKQQ